MKTAENAGANAGSRIVKTFGELFPDGAVLELVASADVDQLSLILSKRNSTVIAFEIEHCGQRYQAEELHGSIRRAIRFPCKPKAYGTIRQLFTKLVATFEEFLGLSKAEAERAGFWVLTTWFCDCLASPPTLWVSGADLGRAAEFFALLHCLCRRAIRVAGVTRAGFLSLPMTFRPTLLVNQPGLPVAVRTLWRETNFRGSVVPNCRGVVLDVTSSKAVFTGMEGATPSPNAENLHLALFPADRELPLLDDAALRTIANYFLPRLLQYRLEQAKKVCESRFTVADLRFPIREVAQKLGACVQDDPELALKVVPLLISQYDSIGQCNLDVAIVQVLWPRLHPSPTTTSAMKVKIEAELTAEVNTFLLACGETLQYSREEIGIRVASFEFTRKHTNTGTILLLSNATNRRVHGLAIASYFPVQNSASGGTHPRARSDSPALIR
jgi:hypothetical protein